MADPEISAMSVISEALDGLEADAQARVLDWATKRYRGTSARIQASDLRGRADLASAELGFEGSASAEFTSFVDLYDAASPSTDTEKALVGGYWFQVVEERGDFGSQEVNNALKNLGYGISNVTRALDRLQERKPALVRQVSKSGRTQQARKRHKLTEAGINAVKDLLRADLGG
jgi:hypothetical protein